MRSIVMLSWVVFPVIALAHHSQTFFSDELTEFAGELVDVEWKNPHIVLTVSLSNEDGERESWQFEADSIYMLQRGGVTRELFPIGEQIRVAAYRSNQTPRAGLLMNIQLPDGREALMHGRGRPRWSDQVIGGTLVVSDSAVRENSARENRGFFRVWSSPQPPNRVMHRPYTASAVAARASFDLTDNFATRCEPEGLPRLMINPHPFEFVDEGADILLKSELYDLVRTIHMDAAPPPEDQPASPLGYSVGAWEEETLVVRSSRINWPYFDNMGTPQSERVEIVERFSLNDDQSRVDYHITVTDPETFTEPATIEGHWLALGEAIEPYQCSVY